MIYRTASASSSSLKSHGIRMRLIPPCWKSSEVQIHGTRTETWARDGRFWVNHLTHYARFEDTQRFVENQHHTVYQPYHWMPRASCTCLTAGCDKRVVKDIGCEVCKRCANPSCSGIKLKFTWFTAKTGGLNGYAASASRLPGYFSGKDRERRDEDETLCT